MKVSIIGFGRIVARFIELVMSHPKHNQIIEINIVSRTPTRVEALIEDFKSAYTYDINFSNFNIISSNKEDSIESSDLIFIASNRAENSIDINIPNDKGGRLYDSINNLRFIKNIGNIIKKYSSESKIFVLTNQVDLNCEVLRKFSNSNNVFGIGNMLDTYRLIYKIKSLCNVEGYTQIYSRLKKAQMFCYHNDNMMLLKNSIDQDLLEDVNCRNILERAVYETVNFGTNINNLNLKSISTGSTGAVIGPAVVLKDILYAYLGIKEKIIFSFNTHLKFNNYLYNLFNENSHVGIGFPISITKGKIEPFTEYIIEKCEIPLVKKEQKNLENILGVILNEKC